jgi:DNA-binding CsgD family transcriptional regulator
VAQRLGVDSASNNAQLLRQYGFYRRASVQQVRMAEKRVLVPNLTSRQVAERREVGYRLMHKGKEARDWKLALIRALPQSLTLKEIAGRLGISYGRAQRWALMANCKFRHATKVAPEMWHRVDWSQPNQTIARRLGVTRELVRLMRRREGIAPVRQPKPIRTLRQRQFARLPAGLTSSEIARRLKITVPHVEYWCQQLGYVLTRQNDRIQVLRQAQFRKLEPGLSLTQIATRLGISCMSARRWRTRYGYRIRDGRKSRWGR